ncbi:hypothetical protein, partial [Ligilactobacillus salivarius]
NKEKLETAILLLKMAREQLELNYSEFNTARFVDEIKEARRLQADVIRGNHVKIWQELRDNDKD